jgi:hypothetical protein
MKNSVKGLILGGIAVMAFVVGVYLHNFQREFVNAMWERHENITDKKPTNAYESYPIQRFQVLVDKDILDDKGRTKILLKQFDTALLKVSQLVSPTQLAELKKTKLWVSLPRHRRVKESVSEVSSRGSQAIAIYRTSTPQTLKRHGHNPDKAKSVEVFNARLFSRVPSDLQLTIVLHELAHAYHDKVLGDRNPDIRDAYNKAMNRGHYNVRDERSPYPDKAYAATNDHEYFAELSVAYLTKNDGFPQDRYVLAKIDPIGYSLMQRIWGAPK